PTNTPTNTPTSTPVCSTNSVTSTAAHYLHKTDVATVNGGYQMNTLTTIKQSIALDTPNAVYTWYSPLYESVNLTAGNFNLHVYLSGLSYIGIPLNYGLFYTNPDGSNPVRIGTGDVTRNHVYDAGMYSYNSNNTTETFTLATSTNSLYLLNKRLMLKVTTPGNLAPASPGSPQPYFHVGDYSYNPCTTYNCTPVTGSVRLITPQYTTASCPTSTPTPAYDPVNHGLRGEYFSGVDLTNLSFRRYDGDVNFDWGQGSPDPTLAVDNYSVRWTAQVEIPAGGPSGTYTFYTVSDDGIRLWVNNQQVVNNWTTHAPTENSGVVTLQAGQRYDIKLEYFESGGGAVARLLWQPPNGTKEVIPSSRLYPATSPVGTHGLKGQYFQGMNLTDLRLTRYEDNVDYNWGNGYPDPLLPVDAFSVRWTGSVRTPAGVSGTYTFYTVADDGVRLWVNDQLIITDWTSHAPVEKSGTITLQGGQTYNIKLEYYEEVAGAVVQLLWLPSGGQKQIIPSTGLYP
ncbi:MAG: PA14 domain-containing protein, partial [Chloroflexota bacterium]|nr:PA14 domain-containing protein [Chloroflexota bacterium]